MNYIFKYLSKIYKMLHMIYNYFSQNKCLIKKAQKNNLNFLLRNQLTKSIYIYIYIYI